LIGDEQKEYSGNGLDPGGLRGEVAKDRDILRAICYDEVERRLRDEASRGGAVEEINR